MVWIVFILSCFFEVIITYHVQLYFCALAVGFYKLTTTRGYGLMLGWYVAIIWLFWGTQICFIWLDDLTTLSFVLFL